MAIFRKVHTSFWSDSFTTDLTSEQKLFYLYVLTNERTKQCGVYEITKKQISFDLGYSIDKVSLLLKFFISKGKIRYNEETKELAIGNWLKYNFSTSPKVKSCIDKEFQLVKDRVLIEYVKSMDTQSQEEQEKEEEQKEEKEDKQTKDEFVSLEFIDSYSLWLEYKKQRKESYANELSREAFYKKLLKLSDNNPTIAIQIVNQSIENNWSGIFELKDSGKKTSRFNNTKGTIHDNNF